jgi:hypothetical protein
MLDSVPKSLRIRLFSVYEYAICTPQHVYLPAAVPAASEAFDGLPARVLTALKNLVLFKREKAGGQKRPPALSWSSKSRT